MDGSANPDREKEDPYHFVAYVPINGVLYELDGLRKSPLMHAAVEGDEWMDQARETIEARIATYPPGSVRTSYSLPACEKDSLAGHVQLVGCTVGSYTPFEQADRGFNDPGRDEDTVGRSTGA